jgi:hypothetical protein
MRFFLLVPTVPRWNVTSDTERPINHSHEDRGNEMKKQILSPSSRGTVPSCFLGRNEGVFNVSHKFLFPLKPRMGVTAVAKRHSLGSPAAAQHGFIQNESMFFGVHQGHGAVENHGAVLDELDLKRS